MTSLVVISNISKGKYSETKNIKVSTVINMKDNMDTVDSHILWGTFNNPTTKIISNNCILSKDTIKGLNVLKDNGIRYEIKECYRSKETTNKIISKFKSFYIKSENGNMNSLLSWMNIDRSKGNVVDLIFLDEHNNILFPKNKYLFFNSSQKTKRLTKYGFENTRYPWTFRYVGS